MKFETKRGGNANIEHRTLNIERTMDNRPLFF